MSQTNVRLPGLSWSELPRIMQLTSALRAVTPPLLFGLRLWAAVCLALYIAFWLELDNAFWAGTSAAIVCQPQPRRLAAQGLVPHDRHDRRRRGDRGADRMLSAGPRRLFCSAWRCGARRARLVATLLRNFAAYAAALAGYHGGDHRKRRARRDRRRERRGLHARGRPRQRDLHRHRLRRRRARRHRFRRRAASAGRPARRNFRRDHRRICQHLAAGRTGAFG